MPERERGLSVRLKLTLSYTAFLLVAGGLMMVAAWFSVLRYIPDNVTFGLAWLAPGRRDPLNGFAWPAALTLAFLVVFGLVGGWLLAGRVLAPLDRITDATRTAATGSLSHRIRLPGRRDELRELADAFDAMLARLEAQVAEQQRFAANASHELRTPLAVTQTLLEVARTDDNPASAELLDRLHAVNARAIDLIEALLLLSRADQRAFPREPVDLSLLAEEATETLLPLAEQRGVRLQTTTDPAPAHGSPPLLLQLTTNLVHNAIVHGHGDVRVATGGAASLVVENSGPRLAPEVVATLTEPFQRGSGRVRGGHAGVGLGLAIARRIAEAHDGTLSLTPRPEGGLRVALRLPPTPPA